MESLGEELDLLQASLKPRIAEQPLRVASLHPDTSHLTPAKIYVAKSVYCVKLLGKLLFRWNMCTVCSPSPSRRSSMLHSPGTA